ncbi:MAG TPA: hypothetical protein VGG16_30040 [Streptosporangiaceae bacterium]
MRYGPLARATAGRGAAEPAPPGPEVPVGLPGSGGGGRARPGLVREMPAGLAPACPVST